MTGPAYDLKPTQSQAGILVGGLLMDAATTIAVENPATGEIAGYGAAATPGQLHDAVTAADIAVRSWAADPGARRRALEAAAEAVSANAEALAHVLTAETGLPIRDAIAEVGAATGFLRQRATCLPLEDTVIHDDDRQSVRVRRAPIGVVAAVIPWNAPIMIGCEKIATALAVGNTVVLKPSPLAPLAVGLLGTLLRDVLPPGVLNIVPGDDRLGAALVAHPRVGMVSFTGSIAAGQAIMAAAATRLCRLSLELGGNDAAIVLPDAPIETMAPKIFAGAFYRGGQVCAAIKRLYVHADVAEPLLAALARIAEASVVGDPLDPATTMGPIGNRPQFTRVCGLVDDALAAGATAVTGGAPGPGPGLFYPPTLVSGAGSDLALVAEEQFGPALPVIPFNGIDEAVTAANATCFGLGASVWTADLEAGAQIAAQLEAGSAWVNRHGVVAPEVPFGGAKHSGLGRANGAAGLDQYSELQTISVARPRRKPAR